MKSKALLCFIVILNLTLSACGFALRKNQLQLDSKYPIIYLPVSGSHTLHQGLQRALLTSSIQVVDHPIIDIAVPKLVVLSQQLSQEPLVYGPDGELRRERIRMAVQFSFSTDVTKQFELFTERDRQLNSKQHLGDNAEKILIEQEMQADILNQLLRFLASGSV